MSRLIKEMRERAALVLLRPKWGDIGDYYQERIAAEIRRLPLVPRGPLSAYQEALLKWMEEWERQQQDYVASKPLGTSVPANSGTETS